MTTTTGGRRAVTESDAELLELKPRQATQRIHAVRTQSQARLAIGLGVGFQCILPLWTRLSVGEVSGRLALYHALLIAAWAVSWFITGRQFVRRRPEFWMSAVMLPLLATSTMIYSLASGTPELGLPFLIACLAFCTIGAAGSTPFWQAAVAANTILVGLSSAVLTLQARPSSEVSKLILAVAPLALFSVITATLLQRHRDRQVQLERKLVDLASVDTLTRLPNRRSFFARANRELARARRFRHETAVLMFDIDDFKRVNDQYGHQVGDEVLAAVAGLFASALREIDIVGRIGGEEFAAMLVETDMEGAQVVAERLRVRIADRSINAHGEVVGVTVSMGLTMLEPQDHSVEAMIRRADSAMMESKRAGKNQVSCWRSSREASITPI